MFHADAFYVDSVNEKSRWNITKGFDGISHFELSGSYVVC